MSDARGCARSAR